MSQTLVDALAQCPLFAEMPYDFVEFLPLWGEVNHFDSGALLFDQGEPGKSMFVLLRGKVRLTLSDPSSPQPRLILTREEGDVLGEMALLDDRERSTQALCLTRCQVFELDRQNFLDLLAKEPKVGLALLRTLTARLREALDREELLRVELERSNRRLDQLNRSLQSRVERATADLRKANATLKDLADRDALTGLYHRTFFMGRLEELLGRDSGPLSLILLDVAAFKAVNDEYGFAHGDQILKEIAALLQQFAPRALISRCGAEEFMLALKCRPELARRKARELIDMVGATSFAGLAPGTIRIQVGVASRSEECATARGLIAAADQGWQQSVRRKPAPRPG